jgi:hypothetical protein
VAPHHPADILPDHVEQFGTDSEEAPIHQYKAPSAEDMPQQDSDDAEHSVAKERWVKNGASASHDAKKPPFSVRREHTHRVI